MQKNKDEPQIQNVIDLADIDVDHIEFDEYKNPKKASVKFADSKYRKQRFTVQLSESCHIDQVYPPQEGDESLKYTMKILITDPVYVKQLYLLEKKMRDNPKLTCSDFNSMFTTTDKNFWLNDPVQLPSEVILRVKFGPSKAEHRLGKWSGVDFLNEQNEQHEQITPDSLQDGGYFESNQRVDCMLKVSSYMSAGKPGLFFKPQIIKVYEAEEQVATFVSRNDSAARPTPTEASSSKKRKLSEDDDNDIGNE